MIRSHILVVFVLLSGSHFLRAQEQFASIQDKFTAWDPIRGAWVFESMRALADGKSLPDRTFPEALTAFQVISMAPNQVRRDIEEAANTSGNGSFVQLIQNLISATFCKTTMGRSYGDPHILTLDKASFSFQTVGEFSLSKSSNNLFEVQARQKAQRSDFSLNTAVAINICGDKVCYYTEDNPVPNASNLWVNGQATKLEGRTYYLPHGGTIRLVGRNYIVDGPFGEEVIMENRASGGIKFINLSVSIPECYQGQTFSGVFGNANGIARDDFNGINPQRNNNLASFGGMNDSQFTNLSQDMEAQYLISLTKDFADDYRVTILTTLFDYAPGQSTSTFTDKTFPIFQRTFNSIPNAQREQARQRCREMGVNDLEMNGCIFDQHYFNLPPNPVPTPPSATEGVVFNKLEHPVVNSNTVVPVMEPKNPVDDPQPKDTEPIKEVDGQSTVKEPTVKPNKPMMESKPIFIESKPKPSSQPAVVPKETPKPNSGVKVITPGKGKN